VTCLRPSQLLDQRFEVRRLIGSGDLGEVYEVTDTTTGKLAAVKLFTCSEATDLVLAQVEQLALRASRAAPDFVAPEARGTAAEGPYLVSELIERPSLAAIVTQARFSPSAVAELVTQLATALDAVHAEGLAHGDLKPHNVFPPVIGSTGAPRITDFGVATLRATSLPLRAKVAGWIGPEQVQGGLATSSSDTYSLAALAFFALTGTSYFRLARADAPQLDSLLAEMGAPATDAVSRAAELGVTLPGALEAVLARALAPLPADRYARASDFARELQEAIGSVRTGRTTRAPKSGKPGRPKFVGTMGGEDEPVETSRRAEAEAPKRAGGAKPSSSGLLEKTHDADMAAVAPEFAPARAVVATPEPPAVGRPEPQEPPAVGRPEPQEPPAVGRPEPPEPPAVGRPEPPEPPAVGRPEPPEPPAVTGPKPPVAEPPLVTAPSPLQAPPPAPPPLVAPPPAASALTEPAPVAPPMVVTPATEPAPAPPPKAIGASPAPPTPPAVAIGADRSPGTDAGARQGRARPRASDSSYAPAEFDMPQTVDDKLELAPHDERPLFSKRYVVAIVVVVVALFALGGAGIWFLLKLNEPLDFPAQPTVQVV
jgi:hypothetical protein